MFINNCYNLPSDLFFSFAEGQRRGHSKKLRKYVFSSRVIDRWNALADVCVNSTTVKSVQKLFETSLGTGNTKLI